MPATVRLCPADAENARTLMKSAENKTVYRRLEVIALSGEGKTYEEIADITKYHYKRVSQIVSGYRSKGIEAIARDGRKGGNHRNMTFEEEEEFLSGFRKDAGSGKILTVSGIKAAYDKKIGSESATATVYFMLERHGWRKLAPRSAHPKKASAEAVEASKKLKQTTKSYWKYITNMEGASV